MENPVRLIWYFKHSRRLLIKNPDRLTEQEKDQVASMLSVSDRLRYAYSLKNEFYKVMSSENSYEARKRLGVWNMMAQGYREELPEFIVCFNTYTNWQINNPLLALPCLKMPSANPYKDWDRN